VGPVCHKVVGRPVGIGPQARCNAAREGGNKGAQGAGRHARAPHGFSLVAPTRMRD